MLLHDMLDVVVCWGVGGLAGHVIHMAEKHSPNAFGRLLPSHLTPPVLLGEQNRGVVLGHHDLPTFSQVT